MTTEFGKKALALHNNYREQHGAPLLEWSEELEKSANEHAKAILLNPDNVPGKPGLVGQNVFEYEAEGYGQVSDDEAVEDAVHSWYEDVANYNPDSPAASKGGNFSQMIWKSTQRVGLSIARKEEDGATGFVILAFYEPPGNYKGQFEENVCVQNTRSLRTTKTGAGPLSSEWSPISTKENSTTSTTEQSSGRSDNSEHTSTQTQSGQDLASQVNSSSTATKTVIEGSNTDTSTTTTTSQDVNSQTETGSNQTQDSASQIATKVTTMSTTVKGSTQEQDAAQNVETGGGIDQNVAGQNITSTKKITTVTTTLKGSTGSESQDVDTTDLSSQNITGTKKVTTTTTTIKGSSDGPAERDVSSTTTIEKLTPADLELTLCQAPGQAPGQNQNSTSTQKTTTTTTKTTTIQGSTTVDGAPPTGVQESDLAQKLQTTITQMANQCLANMKDSGSERRESLTSSQNSTCTKKVTTTTTTVTGQSSSSEPTSAIENIDQTSAQTQAVDNDSTQGQNLVATKKITTVTTTVKGSTEGQPIVQTTPIVDTTTSTNEQNITATGQNLVGTKKITTVTTTTKSSPEEREGSVENLTSGQNTKTVTTTTTTIKGTTMDGVNSILQALSPENVANAPRQITDQDSSHVVTQVDPAQGQNSVTSQSQATQSKTTTTQQMTTTTNTARNIDIVEIEPESSSHVTTTKVTCRDQNDQTTDNTTSSQTVQTETKSSVTTLTKETLDFAVQAHNEIRIKHGASTVTIDDELCQEAQNYARSIVTKTTYVKKIEKVCVGQNIYRLHSQEIDAKEAIRQAVGVWYNKKEEYNWQDPLNSGQGAKLFTQLIWKSCKTIGVAVEREGKETAVVVFYSPPGNIVCEKRYKENVLPASG